MGAALGALFIISLLVMNVQNISQMLQHSTSPAEVTVILIIGASMYFGFGAAVTGFQLAIVDESNQRVSRH